MSFSELLVVQRQLVSHTVTANGSYSDYGERLF